MKNVFFLVNKPEEFDFEHLIRKYLSHVKISAGETFPSDSKKYDLIVLWNYRKILKNVEALKKNIVLFHGSDLPDGKGWAPIYNTIARELKFYTLSGILVADKVDAGDIIVKARFRMKDIYTADILRLWDAEISILLTKLILRRFSGREIRGARQTRPGSFYARRRPKDSEVSLKSSFKDTVLHLRACDKRSPAFFYYRGKKYFIYIEPENKPPFPGDLTINFYDAVR